MDERLVAVYTWSRSAMAVRTTPEFVPAVRAFTDALVDLAFEGRNVSTGTGPVMPLRMGKRYGWLSPSASLQRRPTELAGRSLFVVTCEASSILVADIGALDDALSPQFWRLALDELVISREERAFVAETLSATRFAGNDMEPEAARSTLEELPPNVLAALASFFASRVNEYVESAHPIDRHDEGQPGEWEILFPTSAIRDVALFRSGSS